MEDSPVCADCLARIQVKGSNGVRSPSGQIIWVWTPLPSDVQDFVLFCSTSACPVVQGSWTCHLIFLQNRAVLETCLKNSGSVPAFDVVLFTELLSGSVMRSWWGGVSSNDLDQEACGFFS